MNHHAMSRKATSHPRQTPMTSLPQPPSDAIRDALKRYGFAVATVTPGPAGLLAPGVNGMLELSRDTAIAGDVTAVAVRLSLCAAGRAEGRVVRVSFGKTWRPLPTEPSDPIVLVAELFIGHDWDSPFVAASAISAYRMMRRLLGDLEATLAEARRDRRVAHLAFAACGELATGRCGLVAARAGEAGALQPIARQLCRRVAIEVLPDLSRALRAASQPSTAPDPLIVVDSAATPRLCAEPDDDGAPRLHHRSLQ